MTQHANTPPLRLALALAACGLLTLSAQARPGADGHRRGKARHAEPSQILERLDKNGDGVLTPDDVPEGDRAERLLQRLERLDGDGDGQVTLEELEQAQARRLERAGERGHGHRAGAQARFAENDADGDGLLSLEEYQGQAKRFARLDSDGDGVVLKSELEGERAHRMTRLFDALDKDHDGRLTSAEVEASRVERFERLDADGDGFLTKEELSAKRQQRGGGQQL